MVEHADAVCALLPQRMRGLHLNTLQAIARLHDKVERLAISPRLGHHEAEAGGLAEKIGLGALAQAFASHRRTLGLRRHIPDEVTAGYAVYVENWYVEHMYLLLIYSVKQIPRTCSLLTQLRPARNDKVVGACKGPKTYPLFAPHNKKAPRTHRPMRLL